MVLREFKYNGKQRKVIVFHSNTTQFNGIDLNLLPIEEQQKCLETFKDLVPTAFDVQTTRYENVNSEWFSKAFRRFNENLVEPKDDEEKAEKPKA